MSSDVSWLASREWQRLIIDAAWQSTFVAVLAWVTTRWLVRQPAARARVLLLAMTACVIVPLASLSARSAGWTLLPAPPTLTTISQQRDTPAPQGTSVVPFRERLPRGDSALTLELSKPTQVIDAQPAERRPRVFTGWNALALIWSSCSLLLLGRLALSGFAIRAILRKAKPCQKVTVIRAAAEASSRFGLPNPPRLLLSQHVNCPMILALGRPTVLIPEAPPPQSIGSLNWTAVFSHELAHVIRGDGWARLWGNLVTVLLPLQPLVWLLRHEFQCASEEACDDWAVAAGTDPVDLATTITAWIPDSSGLRTALAIGMSATRTRAHRLLAMRSQPIAGTNRWFRLASAAAAVLLMSGLAVAQPPCESDRSTAAPNDTAAESAELAEKKPAVPPVQQAAEPQFIVGVCVGENQQPLASVLVRLFFEESPSNPDWAQREVAQQSTDAQGRFRLPVARDLEVEVNDCFVVIAQQPGKATVGQSVHATRIPQESIRLVLPPGARLEGTVRTADGTPVPGAVVWAGGPCATGLSRPVPGIGAAMTDGDGHYVIPDLAPARYPRPAPERAEGNQVWQMASGGEVRHADYARQPFQFTAIPSVADVTLHRAATVEGRVVAGPTGEPVAYALVEFWNDLVAADHWTRTRTDANGTYRVPSLPPGTYRLSVRRQGFPNLFRDDVELRSGTNELNLQLEQGGRVVGHMIDVDTGKPVSLQKDEIMQVSACERGGRWYQGMPSTDVQPDGSFSLLLPGGRAYLGTYVGPKWRLRNSFAKEGIQVTPGEATQVEIYIQSKASAGRRELPSVPAPPVASDEQEIVAAIYRLGGWVETEMIDGAPHVVEVNMVYHYDERRIRRENELESDEGLTYLPKLRYLKKLLLRGGQATDEALANLRGIASLEAVFIWDAAQITDVGARELASLPNLEYVHISNGRLTDEAIRHFSNSSKLKDMSLQGNQFTNAALQHAGQMPQLRSLFLGLGESEISDEGLPYLATCTKLEQLDLQGSRVTDAGLVHLRPLKELRELWLGTTAVTQKGLEELRTELPHLKIGR